VNQDVGVHQVGPHILDVARKVNSVRYPQSGDLLVQVLFVLVLAKESAADDHCLGVCGAEGLGERSQKEVLALPRSEASNHHNAPHLAARRAEFAPVQTDGRRRYEHGRPTRSDRGQGGMAVNDDPVDERGQDVSEQGYHCRWEVVRIDPVVQAPHGGDALATTCEQSEDERFHADGDHDVDVFLAKGGAHVRRVPDEADDGAEQPTGTPLMAPRRSDPVIQADHSPVDVAGARPPGDRPVVREEQHRPFLTPRPTLHRGQDRQLGSGVGTGVSEECDAHVRLLG
jgi:hypothetical protein